jgi:hypothetical protein
MPPETGRQEVMLTLEPEDLPALITQTLRAIEEVFFFAGFLRPHYLFGDGEVFLSKKSPILPQ